MGLGLMPVGEEHMVTHVLLWPVVICGTTGQLDIRCLIAEATQMMAYNFKFGPMLLDSVRHIRYICCSWGPSSRLHRVCSCVAMGTLFQHVHTIMDNILLAKNFSFLPWDYV